MQERLPVIGYLMDTDGVLQIGPMTEKQFGRARYKDLLASFSGAQLLLGRFGNVEVGYIDPTMLTGEKQDRLILLAGKSWRITDVDGKWTNLEPRDRTRDFSNIKAGYGQSRRELKAGSP